MEIIIIKNSKLKIKNCGGFTLIESLITLAILGIITSVAVNIFASVVQTYNKANILNELQQNGNYAMAIMKQKLRNAERIEDYETSGSCGDGNVCSGNSWLVIEVKNPATGTPKCIQFGLEIPADTTKNQYIYQENSDPTSGDADCSDPGTGKLEITNVNQTDPKRGIDVTALDFTVDTVVDPPRIKISMSMQQGKGTSTRPQYQAQLDLNTTVSLRSY